MTILWKVVQRSLVAMTVLSALPFVTPQANGASIPAFTIASAPNFGNDPNGFTLGFQFTLTDPINVTHLGYWEDAAFNGNHAVGIFAENGTNTGSSPLVSATVNVNTLATGSTNFVYTALGTPYTLPSGTYRIGAFNGGANYNTANSAVVTAAGISYNQGAYNQGAALAYPQNLYLAYVIANFQFAPVPEPSSLALLALGGLFMWFFKGKRRRAGQGA